MTKKDRYEFLDDRELLDRFYLDGNIEWLGVLFPRFTLLLYGLCLKYLKDEEEAKDAVQQVFLKAMAELPKYRVSYIKSWLYTIAKNHCLMKLRGENAYRVIELKDYHTETPFDADEHYEDKEQLLDGLEKAIAELNEEQRVCIILFYLQKKSYQQVSDETGFSLKQVKSYIQNGKRNLKSIFSARKQ